MSEYPEDGAWPGVRSPNLSKDPLGLAGELTVGPDDLDPDNPRDREELKAMGYDIVDYDDQDSDQMEGVDDWEMDWDAVSPLFEYGPNSDDEDKPEPQLAFNPQSEDDDPFTLW